MKNGIAKTEFYHPTAIRLTQSLSNTNQPIWTDLRGCFPNAEIWKQWCGIVGTFSVDGPKKCSGLEIKQYDENGMKEKFEIANFENIERKREDHITPAGAIQNFVFCSFMKEHR